MAIRLYVNALGRHPGPGRCRVKFRDTEFTSEAMFQVTEASLTCPGQKLSLAHWQDVFILGTSSLKAPGQLPLLRRSVRSRAWAGPLPARPQRRRGWRSEVAVPTASRTPGLAGRALLKMHAGSTWPGPLWSRKSAEWTSRGPFHIICKVVRSMSSTFLTVVAWAALFVSAANASEDARGVDDWSVNEVQAFFKSNGVKVEVSDLESFGLDGHALLTSDEKSLQDLFEKLKLTTVQQTNIISKIAQKRTSIQKAPVDVFEWRVAHHRLVDYWIIPLLSCPRAALIWVRFIDSNHLIEKVNDEIDEIPLLEFWLKWVVSPSYPLYQIASKFSSKTYVDELLEYNFLISAVAEFVILLVMLAGLARGNFSPLLGEAYSFAQLAIGAPLSYYVIYWFIPNFLNHIFFYLCIYVVLPAKCIAIAYLAFLGLVFGGFGAALGRPKTE